MPDVEWPTTETKAKIVWRNVFSSSARIIEVGPHDITAVGDENLKLEFPRASAQTVVTSAGKVTTFTVGDHVLTLAGTAPEPRRQADVLVMAAVDALRAADASPAGITARDVMCVEVALGMWRRSFR